MDAVKILGTLLSQNALGSKAGGNILGTLLGDASGKGGGAADIFSTLLGGKKGTGGSSLAALAAIAATVAAGQSKKGGKATGGGDLLGSLLGEVAGEGGLGGLRSLLGGSPAPTATSAPGSGLGDLVGSLLGGGKTNPAAPAGGLGDLVGSLLGGGVGAAPGSAPGLGGLLGSLLGGAAGNAGIAAGEAVAEVDPAEAEESAKLLIEAMCHAAKCDGHVDAQEREAILGRAGDLDADEVAYLNDLLSSPTNLDSFVRRVPEGMAEQVYAFSLMAVKLDSRSEAEYFTRLAQGLGLDGTTANGIHASLGQPEIFA